MVQISFSKREILVKIVYYGMGLCGKTTSLQYLHSIMDDSNTTKLFSVKTDEDQATAARPVMHYFRLPPG